MSEKTIHSVGIIMNGVTGRMGTNQHLRRSIYAIMQQGGVKLSPTAKSSCPSPILVGPQRREARGHQRRVRRHSLDAPISTRRSPIPRYSIYFDAQTTDRRADAVRKAIAAGKHIYCEKPIADSLDAALELYRRSPRRPASSTASCRTSSGCPAC